MIDFLDKNIFRILSVFTLSPGSRLNRITIQEKTKINNIVLDKSLNQLINLNYLVKEKNLYSINFKNQEVLSLIESLSKNYNKFKMLPLKEYFLIQNIIWEISKIKYIGDVYLFGSYAKLIFKDSSDIDFAVISDKIKKAEVNKSIRKIEKKENKKIEFHFFTKEFYHNKKDPLVKEILRDGVKVL
jgi:predicted nucleotidyltransferase